MTKPTTMLCQSSVFSSAIAGEHRTECRHAADYLPPPSCRNAERRSSAHRTESLQHDDQYGGHLGLFTF